MVGVVFVAAVVGGSCALIGAEVAVLTGGMVAAGPSADKTATSAVPDIALW